MYKFYSIILLITITINATAQTKFNSISISLFNESTAIPFTQFLTLPIHPGIQIGTEFNYTKRPHSRFFQTANTSYFFHHYLTQGIGLTSEFGYEYRLKNGLSFSSLIGIGYLHTFSTAQEYIFKNGKYVKKADFGNARLYPSFSFDLGYHLKPTNKNSTQLFIRYQSWLEYPYSPGFIPIMAHINLHIGAKFNSLKTKRK